MQQDDLDFMPGTYAAAVEELPFLAHAMLWLTFVFLVTAIIWANLASVDEVARAEGRVIPSSQIQIVQNLEGGILAEVAIKEGDLVERGEILMRLDDTRFASSFNEGKLTSQALIARVARLEAEIANEPFIPPADFPLEHMDLIHGETSLFNARKIELKSGIDILYQQLNQHKQTLAELRAEQGKLERNAELAKEELTLTEPLVETGAVSQVELLRLRVAVNESVGRLEVKIGRASCRERV